MVENREQTASSLSKQRERFVLELQHLNQTYKSGLLQEQEYLIAKKSVEKKLALLDQKTKQTEAKEKAVEEILGSSSIFSKHQTKKTHSSHTSLPIITRKHNEKVDQTKNERVDQKKDEKVYTKEERKEDKTGDQKQDEKGDQTQNIDEFIERENTNWRFALAILTLFLVILLYVKFTSFGGASDVLPIDAYLGNINSNSSYNKDMYLVLSQLEMEYGESLSVSYSIVGREEQNILLGIALRCAEHQNQKREYLAYIFQETTIGFDEAIGFDELVFSTCLSDPAIKEQYLLSQEEIASLDITHTPTLIINNKKVVGAVGYDIVKSIIDAEMTS